MEPENTDLFARWNELPAEVQTILNSFQDNTYAECERLLKTLKPLGYTFQYGLDGEPFNLMKIDSPIIVNGYKIEYSESWEDYQISHPEIGACGRFKNIDEAIDYCDRG